MREYLQRTIDDELDEMLAGLAAVSVEGAKAVGKTFSASRRASTSYRLDEDELRTVIEADPSRLLTGARPILIDEWQRSPASWDVVRRAVDDGAPAGSFLLTGSASPVAGTTAHSGAGRIVTLRMRPMTLTERGVASPTVSLQELLRGVRPEVAGDTELRLADYVAEILRSGFPGLRGLSDRNLKAQLDGYVDRITERDLPELGVNVRNPSALRRWLTAYAASSSTTASYETIRDAASGGHRGEKPSKNATGPYRDALTRLWIVDPVPAWLPSRSRLRRLAAAPKHQLVDPALAARLLGVGSGALLDAKGSGLPIPRDGTLLGALFESLVTLDVRVAAQAAGARVSHLRTAGGEHEVDLIVERDDGRVIAVEVKLGATVSDSDARHLHWLSETIGEELVDAVIVTTGAHAFRREDGIAVVPAALLGP